MELLVALFQVEGASSATDFVDVVKLLKDAPPSVLTVRPLLSTILSMLGENSLDKNGALDQFAPRVLANLLQAKFSLIFCDDSADSIPFNEAARSLIRLFSQPISVLLVQNCRAFFIIYSIITRTVSTRRRSE